jgi:hypothetical protein
MDVGLYISELLKRDGEIVVPGLGFLVYERLSAWYNESEGKFYPPYHKVSFDPQVIDDDTLSQYIADSKNISFESAKYFTEKYIANLKHDALSGDVAFADLGWFCMDQEAIVFKNQEKLTEETELYGLEPVEINKQKREPFTKQPEQKAPYQNEDLPDITFTSKGGTGEREEEEKFPSVIQLEKVFEGESKNKTAIMLYTLLALILVGIIGLASIYKFAPVTFEKIRSWEQHIRGKKIDTTNVVKQIPVVIPKRDSMITDSIAKKPDTTAVKQTTAPPVGSKSPETKPSVKESVTPAKKPVSKKDSTSKTKTPVTGTAVNTTLIRFELVVASFDTNSKAMAAMHKFNSDGLKTNISVYIPGSKYHVVTDNIFDTYADAEAAKLQLIKDHKIPSTSYPQEIKLSK